VTVVPAHGLTLVEVTYPPDGQLAARVHSARQKRSFAASTDTGEPAHDAWD